jgi:uncharacterized protein YhaN
VRLLGLHLLAYGPFTNVELDLMPEGVHVVYGRNEAGKSTALRAITGLLYGIARNTPDAHVHKMPDLRVGGRFRAADGGSLYLVRRKGKDNTLLDRDGRPVDEAVLARLLGGVSEEQFLTMFGLDHESLRRGGESLLSGEGNVGESLFGAAVAGGELHQVLRSLRTEAEQLFTPRAHARSLNEALKVYADAHRRTRDESMSPESMFEQEKNLVELKRQKADCDAERQRLHVERMKLQRACQALPVIGKRRLVDERRAAMGEVVPLTPDAPSRRLEEQRALSAAAVEIARLEALGEELRARREKLVVPESLVKFEEVPLDLRNRLGSHLKAVKDLPKIDEQARDLENEACERLRRAGQNADLEGIERRRVDALKQAALRKLAIEKATLSEARQHTARFSEERRARRGALVARSAKAKPAPDVGALKKAVTRAERAGPLEERLATALAQAGRIDQKARAQLSSLGLGGRSLAEATGLAIVSDETVERFARELATIERDEEDLAKQSALLETRKGELAREIQGLELEGKVPTEGDLLAARERREASWQEVRRALRSPAKGSRTELLSAHETDVRAADEIADRLRREAERVGRLSSLLAERGACEERAAAARERVGLLAARRDAHTAAWRAQWQPLGVVPGPPAEMKAWLAAHAALVRTAEDLSSTEADAAALRASIETHREPLGALLVEQSSPAPGASLGSLLDRAADVIEAADRAAAEKRDIDHGIEEIDAELAVKVAEEREQARALARLEKSWTEAASLLGLSGDATPDDVTMTIDLLAQVFQNVDQAVDKRRRAAGIQRDAAAFAADVDGLAREHAPDLADGAAEAVAAELLDRYKRGREALVERREIDRQIADTIEMLSNQRERVRGAETRLQALVAAAGAGDVHALEIAEQRSADARDLDRQVGELDAELLGMGLAANALPEDLRDLDLDAATARLEEVDAALSQFHELRGVLDQRIRGNEEGLKKLESPQASAAAAALEAEAALASVREIAERYARIKVASVVLAREIERYRQENQGPIVTRASELFARLTLGSFSGLRTDFDDKDQPILLGVRGAGSDVRVGEMSDGTRDQLYLALYLATLERFARGGDPMPLIVDDVLIHFDDDRARAALEVLGELSEHTQVLFFTHHARLVELAREAIPGEKLFVRELQS